MFLVSILVSLFMTDKSTMLLIMSVAHIIDHDSNRIRCLILTEQKSPLKI